MKNQVVIYQAKSGAIAFKRDFDQETLWASQSQISDLFGVHQSVVSRHIKNIFNDGEIDAKSNMQKMHNPHSDKPIMLYSLDVLLSVGYRTNSKVAIAFRRWATKTLQQHLLDGYTINSQRLVKNYDTFLKAVEDVKKLLPAGGKIKTEDVLELIKIFASTWFSLDAYDKTALPTGGMTKKKVKVTLSDFKKALLQLKNNLISKKEATDFFAQEKQNGGVDAIIGNIFQAFDGHELYPTVEDKASHLLYFIVKNHPFVDGNKRSGAFAFVWFLQKATILDVRRLTPEALTALTLLIAESNPREKSRIIGLILSMLKT